MDSKKNAEALFTHFDALRPTSKEEILSICKSPYFQQSVKTLNEVIMSANALAFGVQFGLEMHTRKSTSSIRHF